MMQSDMERQSFLDERSKGIGGSDCASVFNVGYGCARRLWYEKSGAVPDYPFDESKAIRLGRLLEPFFADEYARETGRTLTTPAAIMRMDLPMILVHVDRLVKRDDNTWGAAEIKSLGRAAFYQARREGLSESYILQVQHALVCTGLEFGVFIIGCRDTGEIVYWDVPRDENICQLIESEAPAFWSDVLAGIAPDRLDADDKRCRRCEYRRTCQGQAIETGPQRDESMPQAPELLPLLERYKELDAKYCVKIGDEWGTELDAEYAEVKEEIKAAMGDRQGAFVGRAKVYHRPQEGREKWDMKGLLKEYIAMAEYIAKISDRAGIAPNAFVSRGKPFKTLRIYLEGK
jgi:predicted phage-related endonuclease